MRSGATLASRHPLHQRRARRGFTLIEVLVALAIGTIVLVALAIVFARHSGNQSELERAMRQMESARFAMDLLVEDIMHAGYYGEFNPDTMAPAPVYGTPTPCTTSLADLGWATPVGAPTLPTAVQGITAAAVFGCLDNRAANTEALIVRHAETGDAQTIASALAAPGNLYVQVSRCGSDDRRIAVGNTAAALALQLPGCAAVHDSVRRLAQRAYFIASCNDCGAGGDGIPTLKRAEWVNGALRTVALAEGIEQLRFEYGLDTDGNGVPDNFVGPAGITGVAPAQWQNVVAVRVHLLTRATQATPGWVDVRTYQLRDLAYAPADAFKRTLLSSTVRLVNVGGRRD